MQRGGSLRQPRDGAIHAAAQPARCELNGELPPGRGIKALDLEARAAGAELVQDAILGAPPGLEIALLEAVYMLWRRCPAEPIPDGALALVGRIRHRNASAVRAAGLALDGRVNGLDGMRDRRGQFWHG